MLRSMTNIDYFPVISNSTLSIAKENLNYPKTDDLTTLSTDITSKLVYINLSRQNMIDYRLIKSIDK